MTVHDVSLNTLDGSSSSLAEFGGSTILIVNVASACGLTPQYEGLQKLHDTYSDRGFSVLGFPCNQFGEQEPGTAAEIRKFCDSNYSVTFPLYEKIEVNGDGRHALYEELTATVDVNDGHTGDIRWNFEKFLVGADGEVVARFGPVVAPDDEALVAAIESQLAH